MQIDLNTKFGARVQERLQNEMVIWLTTVSPDGTPQPNPVWFLWDGDAFLIYTQPGSVKMRNIQRNPHVSLNFNSTFDGDDVIIFTGQAAFDLDAAASQLDSNYLEKYRQGITDIEMTPESMAADYNVCLRIVPERVRGF